MSQTRLRKVDLIYAGINGSIFGILLPVVLRSFNAPIRLPYLFSVIFFVCLAVFGVYVGYLLGRFKTFFFQLAKFGATGAANFAIDIGILSLLVILFFPENAIIPPTYYALFKSISFILATTNSYVWNKYWSFLDKDKKDTWKEFGRFVLVSLTGLLLNTTVATLVNSLYGLLHLSIDVKAWATVSAMVAAVTVLTWNFVGYKFLVFKK